MFFLPAPSLTLISGLPIPEDFRKLPDHLIIRIIVLFTSKYRELVPDLSSPRIWAGFKAHIAERCQALKISDLYVRLYENDEYFTRLLFQYSFMEQFQKGLMELAEETGYSDLVTQQVSTADLERLRAFFNIILEELHEVVQEIESFDDWERIEADGKHYWEHIHPTLPLEEQRQTEKDGQIFFCQFLFGIHNSISVMAYGETLTSLVQRAIGGGADADTAMCKAVRVDNSLRQHPEFMARYLLAGGKSESAFLRKYNNTSPPLTNKIRYPGLYFLLALLDGYGLLDRLTNPQLLDLCDHARLDKWENRIEDEGYLAKRRNEYQRHKFIQMSTHSN